MNETQRRIKAYKAALPGLRERVIAVALLLAMSVAMMTSATFAWITLSRAPEVSGVSTTVAANGNLEIALATGNGTVAPGESKVGDSSAAENQTITGANVTWGNLVNLSDPVYGLNQMALRPALLSDYNLNRYPLYGASYGKDGRVEAVTTRYEYATWTTASNGTPYFAAGDKMTHGVRAIASVTYENITGNAVFTELFTKANEQYNNSRTGYINLLTDKTPIQDHAGANSTTTKALSGLLSIYTQDMVNTYMPGGSGSSDSDCSYYVVLLYNMMLELEEILRYEGEALVWLANAQAYMTDNSVGTETYKNWNALYETIKNDTSNSVLNAKGITLNSLTAAANGLRTDWKVLHQQIDAIEKLMTDKGFYTENGGYKTSLPEVKFSEFESIVNNIVHIDSTEMNGTAIGNLNSDNVGDFAGTVLGGGTADVVIKKGLLKNLEQRTGVRMADRNTMNQEIKVSVKVKVPILGNKTVNAVVTTDAAPDYMTVIDKAHTEKMNENVQGGDAVAKDIYGMAIDLWVRTNTDNVVLTLEGNTIYDVVRATGKDQSGNDVELFVLDTEDGKIDIYKYDEDDKWYSLETHQEIDAALIADFDETDEQNFKMTNIVMGYGGENRVWEDWQTMLDNNLIEEDNTTQGAGSCFVFYASPSEQDRILDLLQAFTVAFVNDSGTRLGTAMLAIDRAYAINGKVTVPLEMIDGTEYEDEDGDEQYGITALERNDATRISAIVYLNGMNLKNENVLADGSIEGNLNLQFGSSVSLTNPLNENLQAEYRTITAMASTTAEVEKGSPTTSANQNSPIKFTYDGTEKPVSVVLTVDGVQPEKITGFFVRTISSTQGSRGDKVNFRINENGTWTGDFRLTTPGTYLLRTLMVDGVEYTLDSIPAVSISGLDYDIICDFEPGLHMTADKSVDVTVSARIHADANLMPGQVRAQFRSKDGSEHNALMSYDIKTGLWSGTAAINSSGTYTLEYIIMDGEYYELKENEKLTLIFSLGMTTRVYSDHVSNFTYQGDNIPIVIKAKVWDDKDNEIKKLEGVNLYYHIAGSSLDQNGLHTAMAWNDDTGYYEGNFLVKNPGIFSFDRLQVNNISGGDSSTIRTAASAPVFTAISLDPPSYRGYVPKEYQLAPISTDDKGIEYIADPAELTISMNNAGSASIWGIVKKGSTSYVVKGVPNNNSGQETVDGKTVRYNEFEFTIPGSESVNGVVPGQDGEWKLVDIYLQNVYIKDEGRMYNNTVAEGTVPSLSDLTDNLKDAESGETVMGANNQPLKAFYHIGLSDEGGDKGIYAYVVSTIKVEITKDGAAYTGAAFGGTKANPTGVFMTSYPVSGVAVTVRDWANKPITGVDGVTWSISYDSTTDVAYGGYDGASLSLNEVTLTKDGSDATKYTAATQNFQYAGEYKSTVTVSMNGSPFRSITGPSFTVASVKPTVTLASVSPTTANMPIRINWSVKIDKAWGREIGRKLEHSLEGKATNGITTITENNVQKLQVTAYARAATSGVEGVGTGDAGFERPVLNFTVAGVDSKSTVKFTIPGNSAVSVDAKNFSRTGNTGEGETVAITLGRTANFYTFNGTGIYVASYSVRAFYGHGTQEITSFTIERDGKTFTVDFEKPIKIINPSSENKNP